MADLVRMFELRLNGYCCSQIVLKMGLEEAGRAENPDMIQAARGLCYGLQGEMLCGLLTAAACLVALLRPEDAKILIADLAEWFESEFGEDGGIACKDILAGDPLNRSTKCPQILAATYDKVLELLQ